MRVSDCREMIRSTEINFDRALADECDVGMLFEQRLLVNDRGRFGVRGERNGQGQETKELEVA